MKIEAFKKIIREEVRAVIKEELSLIMQTPITETKTVKKPVLEQKQIKNPVVDNIKKGISSKIKSTPQQPAKPLFDSKDPKCKEIVYDKAPTIYEYITDQDREHFLNVCEI